MTGKEPTLSERLRHAAMTASNDDLSEYATEERARHVERFSAMLYSADLIDSQAARIAELEASQKPELAEQMTRLVFSDTAAGLMEEAEALADSQAQLLAEAKEVVMALEGHVFVRSKRGDAPNEGEDDIDLVPFPDTRALLIQARVFLSKLEVE